MNKKKLFSAWTAVVILVSSLTACSKEAGLMIPFTDSSGPLGYVAGTDIPDTTADLFADSLCIVPVGSDTDTDGNLDGISTMLVDVTDQNVIYANHVFDKVYPASITKIVTALVVLNHADLSDTVTVSHNAANITEPGAKKLGLKEGDKIKLDTLFTSFLIYSGNDAGIAIAEHIAGSEEAFADMMNNEVKKLGAVDSNFVNAHGLHDKNHYTTVYDIYLVLNELVKNERFVEIISTKSYKAGYEDKDGNPVNKEFSTTNRYLNGKEKMPEGITVIGGKTGTTSKAGSCLVLYSQGDNGHQYLSFIFKTASGDALFSQMSYLLKLINR